MCDECIVQNNDIPSGKILPTGVVISRLEHLQKQLENTPKRLTHKAVIKLLLEELNALKTKCEDEFDPLMHLLYKRKEIKRKAYRKCMLQILKMAKLRYCDLRIQPRVDVDMRGDLEITFLIEKSTETHKFASQRMNTVPWNTHEITKIVTSCEKILLVEKRCVAKMLTYRKKNEIQIFSPGIPSLATYLFIDKVREFKPSIRVEHLSDFDLGGVVFAQTVKSYLPESHYIGISWRQVEHNDKKQLTEGQVQKVKVELNPAWKEHLRKMFMMGSRFINEFDNLEEVLSRDPGSYTASKKQQESEPPKKKRKVDSPGCTAKKPRFKQEADGPSLIVDVFAGKKKYANDEMIFLEEQWFNGGDMNELLEDPTGWLSQSQVDVACRIPLNNDNMEYDVISSELICNFIMNSVIRYSIEREPARENLNETLKNVFGSNRVVAIPYTDSTHWTVSVVDNPKKTVTVYDSSKSRELDAAFQSHVRFIRHIAEQTGSDINDYTFGIVNDHTQDDAFSCGLFVIERVRSIFENRPFCPKNVANKDNKAKGDNTGKEILWQYFHDARERSEYAGRRDQH
jgi:hypothetical protein